jgi:hypothetical protein
MDSKWIPVRSRAVSGTMIEVLSKGKVPLEAREASLLN